VSASATQRRTIDLSSANWNITLDPQAEWKSDKLFLPPVDINTLPVNLPSQGWNTVFQNADIKDVKLPATIEEYLWGWNGETAGVTGNYVGVSWFTTKIVVPAEWKNKRIIMKVESVRFRAEIFVNQQLAGYDLVNSTPFEIDLSNYINAGQENQIAFRITDPNGNFNWKDSQIYTWGIYDTNPSHGFGGISGKVTLESTDDVFIENIFIKNRPNPKEIEIELTAKNLLNLVAENQNLSFEIIDYQSNKTIFSKTDKIKFLPQGKSTFTYKITVPQAKLWSVDEPNLYLLKVRFANDELTERFGFRWFEVKDNKGDRQLYLNGKRIVLRSAISWGYWPDNGIVPSDEYARKQILAAKRLGLNMLSFHRAIGQTNVMDAADELGLLIWEEPGGNQYSANKFNSNDLQSTFYFAYRNEKLTRMIERDRNHPSLIIYNLHNERGAFPQAKDSAEMQMAHRIDPTRQIIYNSSNGENPEGEHNARFKLHLLPYDTTFYDIGWYDCHHAGGPGVYHDKLYQSPTDYLRFTKNKAEINYWGEEGAIGTPPRLELIRKDILENKKTAGWEAADYLEWYNAYDNFLKTKGFDKAFPTVDALTVAMGNVAYYYQGRIIENIRISNTNDGYAVNGWEAMKLENHSGIVDNYRNHKGDPNLIARYNEPLVLSVKLNRKVVEVGDTVTADIYIINEKNLKGNFKLTISQINEKNKVISSISKNVKVSGGTDYGQLLVAGLQFKINNAGYTKISAGLISGKKAQKEVYPEEEIYYPQGDDQVFAVKPNVAGVSKTILVADTTNVLQNFMRNFGFEVTDYRRGIPQGETLLVGAFEPQQWGSNMSDIIEWVHKGGKLVVVDNPVRWAEFFADKEVLDYRGSKVLGTSWYGGNFFNREHPIFAGLPVNTAFNWEYQCFSAYNRRRIGLRVESGETLVGCVSDHKKEVYSALSRIPVGRGVIYITTLDIPQCIKTVNKNFAIDIDGMNESMNTFNQSNTNSANVVGIQLLFNMLKE
jgi:hypothetical protein